MTAKKISIFLLIYAFLALYYKINMQAITKEDYKIYDVRIYQNTPAWDLALAVKGQKVNNIKQILNKKPDLVNYQDPKYDATLLLWSIGMEKYKSAETLLKCGADPNIVRKTNGQTPLFLAAGYSWIDRKAKKDPKYVKLLLRYGADPNKNYTGSSNSGTEPGTSPLMKSIGCGIEKTRALVEAGADINYKTELGTTAAIIALYKDNFPEYAHYLVVEKKAKVSEPYYGIFSYSDPKKLFYPVDLLRYWLFDLNSKEYKMKMEIVAEFARQGVNYWETKIHPSILEQIKKLYPDTWEEYIKKY